MVHSTGRLYTYESRKLVGRLHKNSVIIRIRENICLIVTKLRRSARNNSAVRSGLAKRESDDRTRYKYYYQSGDQKLAIL